MIAKNDTRHLDAVRSRGGEFRHELFNAARDGYRLHALGLLDMDTMAEDLRQVVVRVWNADPDEADKVIVNNDARKAAARSPWALVGPTSAPAGSSPGAHDLAGEGGFKFLDPAQTAEINAEAGAMEETARFDADVAYRLRQLDVNDEAARRKADRDRQPLTVLSASAFLSAPPPEYLVPGMLYRDGLAVVFGAPGAAKSFLVLDIALSLATGTPWRGQHLGRSRVHYVMAEGQATNTLRSWAWLAHRGVDPGDLDDWLTVVPTAVMLTDAGVVEYARRVEAERPDLIVLDTKNLMYVGKESQGDDYGAMLRVLHRLREAAGGAAVVLIDHSGLTDDTRTRGSNAQKGGVETEIRVTHEGGVRRAIVTRDKSGEEGAVWAYKLEQVPEVPRPAGVMAPAVCVPLDEADLAEITPWRIDEDWNDPAQPPLPEDVTGFRGHGQTAILALARFMRYSASTGVGFTMVSAVKAVRVRYVDERGKAKWSEDTVQRAWGSLVDPLDRLVVAETGGATSRSMWQTKPGDPT